MKRIDPNVASKLINKENEKYDFKKKLWNLNDELLRVEAYLQVLQGYVTSDIDHGDNEKVLPFIDDLAKIVEGIKEGINEVTRLLSDAGRLGSHFEGKGEDMVFLKSTTMIERIPTTFYREKTKEGKEKKAA